MRSRNRRRQERKLRTAYLGLSCDLTPAPSRGRTSLCWTNAISARLDHFRALQSRRSSGSAKLASGLSRKIAPGTTSSADTPGTPWNSVIPDSRTRRTPDRLVPPGIPLARYHRALMIRKSKTRSGKDANFDELERLQEGSVEAAYPRSNAAASGERQFQSQHRYPARATHAEAFLPSCSTEQRCHFR